MQTPEEIAQELDLDAKNAEGWRPNVGDLLVGRVIQIEQGFSQVGGKTYPILIIKPEGRPPVSVHCFHRTLLARVMALRPMVNETVAIRLQNIEPTKDGQRKVYVYAMKIKGRDVTDPYNAIEVAQRAEHLFDE